ncbi:putative membrane protein YkvI [Providencia alcalifaciens]|nr:putative membrane protein YkvI [Providencia alcalifaciens]
MPKINELKRQELSYRLNSESFKAVVKKQIRWDWIAIITSAFIILTLIMR